MEITTKNFKSTLPNVKRAIESADFLAFDAEFTGLRRDSVYAYNELDTAEERYTKARMAAKDFGMIQFGVTAFRYVKEEKKYAHVTFCFYLLGKSGEINYYDSSSLRFLANNGFDFTKLFKEGLPYMTLKEEEEKRSDIDNAVMLHAPSPVKVTEESAKKFLAEMDRKLTEFIADEEESKLVIPGSTLTGFFRKLLYNNIAAKFPNLLIQNINTNGERNVEIRKFETNMDRMEFLQNERLKQIDDQVGFTHIVRQILESGKVIVGHNLVLDLLHMIDKTVQPLPEQFENFKMLVKENLPTVYDTKFIAKDPPFCVNIPITSLELLYKDLCEKYKPPTFALDKEYANDDYYAEGKAHNAGYDSFMTGVCFATMVKKLDGAQWAKNSVVKSKHLPVYANKIYNMSSYDVPCLNLVGPDVVPSRSHIFSVECPSSWKPMHVHGLFHMIKSLKIVWRNSTHLYVIPMEGSDNTSCKEILKSVRAACPPLVSVKMYDEKPSQKRKSESDDMHTDRLNMDRPKEFKRLKSVGSEQMSKMTLESPIEEASKMTVKSGKKTKKDSSQGVFELPDW